MARRPAANGAPGRRALRSAFVSNFGACYKLAILGTAKATPSQRTALLRCLYGVLSLYIQDDFSAVTSMCEQVEDAYRMEDGSPELDTQG